MIGVVVNVAADGVSILTTSKLTLGATRERSAVAAFQSALTTVLNEARAERIGVKAKPESGEMQAGSAALKMEALLLANARCDVAFLQTRDIEAAAGRHPYLHAEYSFQNTALCVALAAAYNA